MKKPNLTWKRCAEKVRDSASANLQGMTVISLWNIYLVASYMYYVRDESLMEDSRFDQLCAELLSQGLSSLYSAGAWHLPLFCEDALRAGTGFHITIHTVPHSIECIGDTIINLIEKEEG